MANLLLVPLACAFLLSSVLAQPTCSASQASWTGSAVAYEQQGTSYAFIPRDSSAGCRLDTSSIGNFQFVSFSVVQLNNGGNDCTCVGGGTLLQGTECNVNPLFGCPSDWSCAICVNQEGANGDPHFVGLDGFAFDLQGEPDHYYNMLSNSDTQATFGIVPRGSHHAESRGGWYRLPTHKNTSTWIGAFSVKHRGDVVTIVKHEDMSLQVELNNQPLAYDSKAMTNNGMAVTYVNKLHKGGVNTHKLYATTNVEDDYTTQHVSIDTPLFLFDVDIPPTFSQRMDVWVGLHQSPAVLEGQCTGVIGETVRAEHPLGARDMEEVYGDVKKVWDEHENEHIRVSATLEAEIKAKYEVSSLVSDDFSLNKYKGAPQQHIDRARKLVEQYMPFPRAVVASTLVHK